MNYLSIGKLVAFSLIVVVGCGSNSKDQDQTQNGLAEQNKDFSSIVAGLVPDIAYDASIVFSPQDLKDNGFIIKGKVENFQGVVYLHELTPTKLNFKDSVRVDANNQFEIKGSFAEPTLCFLTFNSPNPPGIPVVLSNNKLGLTISFGDVISYATNGDKDNELISELYRIYAGHDLAMYKFNQEVQNIDPATANDSLRNSIQKKFADLSAQREKEITEFATKKPGSPATYFAVTFLFEQPTAPLLEGAYAQMNKNIPNSKYTREVKEKIDMIGPLDIGGLAPDIELMDPDGKVVKLSSLRGKVVLIDFWASWCRPCRMENPNVKRVYDKYKSKGFEIYGVSLDNAKDKWVSAIAADGLTWKHVSDLKGWQSAAAQRYQVNSIPYTVLLDKNGRIIAKGLRSEALEQKLATLLN